MPSDTGGASSSQVIAAATVDRVERISPSFARVWFRGPDLADFGTPGRTFDQRIKVILPPPSGRLPRLSAGSDWWTQWQALPEAARGVMRTYSIRDIQGEGADTSIVVDFVLHLAEGLAGPASRWASLAAPGDRVLLFGPRRGVIGSGLEFRPADATTVLLAGDETAAPAIARILLDLEPGPGGAAFIEVPTASDALPLPAPPGFEVRWLPRNGSSYGARLIPAVLEQLGVRQHGAVQDAATEFPVWETPSYSSLGEELSGADGRPGLYAWIAGESGVVTTLRRHLVRDLGLARSQVAFMGYWRIGRAGS
ncbi:MAG: siderophore-interacting protein [Propionicimonas sp.]|nr:siderophore-interacting protein [Propionicimonas sp.]